MKRVLVGLVATAFLAPCTPALGAPAATTSTGGAAAQTTWSADQVRAPEARARGRSGAGVTVAVLDTWVDGSHPDFEGRVLAGADCIGGTCVAGQRTDECDHGTHVAGTLSSSSFGIAPRARVLPVRVLSYDPDSKECTGRPADVAAGIDYAVAQGARVLNLSLGADVPGLAIGPLPMAVDAAVRRGVVVVFSAGNGDVPVADVYGGKAVVVAATGPKGQLASYSQRGRGVTVAAPGGDAVRPDSCTRNACVTSLYPGGKYAVAAGTSMAAPVVSGIAALLIAQNPARTGPAVRAQILKTARPLSGAGAGLVDAAAALGAQARTQPVPAGVPLTRPRAAAAVLPAPSELPLDIRRAIAVDGMTDVDDDDALPNFQTVLAALVLALAGGAWVVYRKPSAGPSGPASGRSSRLQL